MATFNKNKNNQFERRSDWFFFILKAYSRSDWFFFILKVANIRCFILIAVDVYHTYLTWNEGNMSLFDFLTTSKEFNVYQHDIHIFMNMIIWPLMTYTVTSFDKALAHVRNCLLKKAHVINKNIDGFYAKTTQEDSARFV